MSATAQHNIEISQKLFRWAIGYLHHHIPCDDDVALFGFSRVVNYAFACELLLKSHLARENGPSGGHKLKPLFEKLEGQTQNDVSDIVKNRFPGKIYGTEDFDFDTMLKEQTYMFVEWRYPYDKNFTTPLRAQRGHYGFLFILGLALIKVYQTKYNERPDYNGKCPIPQLPKGVDVYYTIH